MLTKDFERITVRDCGTALTVRISPCSWMYESHGLQIQLQMSSKDIANGGVAYIHNKALRFEDATEADVVDMAAKVGIVRCSRCQKQAFDPATVDTNRAGLCEECFLADLNADLEKAQADDVAHMKLIDAEMLAKGMPFRVDAWIHPKAGGDDYQTTIYFSAKPTKALIQRELRKAGSCVLNDYTILPQIKAAE